MRQAYAENGADVALFDLPEQDDTVEYELGTSTELEETAELVEAEDQRALTLTGDVSDGIEVEAAVEQTKSELGTIDILANNAGICPYSGLLELDEAAWDATVNVNMKGTWLCSKFVAEQMIADDTDGRIVNTGSVNSFVATINNGHYAASKHGVLGLTKAFAVELAAHDINVNAVCPGAVQTPGGESRREAYDEGVDTTYSGPFSVIEPEGDLLSPEDISEAFMWLSSDAAKYVNGIALPVDTGFLAT
jgi:NAD(P)-dependent dehydrogenase (short-subunit alcohol dehydrogenase family)